MSKSMMGFGSGKSALQGIKENRAMSSGTGMPQQKGIPGMSGVPRNRNEESFAAPPMRGGPSVSGDSSSIFGLMSGGPQVIGGGGPRTPSAETSPSASFSGGLNPMMGMERWNPSASIFGAAGMQPSAFGPPPGLSMGPSRPSMGIPGGPGLMPPMNLPGIPRMGPQNSQVVPEWGMGPYGPSVSGGSMSF